MRAGADRRGWAGAVAVLALFFVGCGATTGLEGQDAGALRCNPDEVSPCACPGGESGTQSCRLDRTFGDCECRLAGEEGDASASEDGSPPASKPVSLEAASGKVNCGVMAPASCDLAAGERCCILDPGIDHCIGPDESCECTGPGCNVTLASCDGPEDCDGDQVCCGSFTGGAYTSLECKASCQGTNQREICHPGSEDACSDEDAVCGPSATLPKGLFRCE